MEDCIAQSDCPLPRDVQGGLDRASSSSSTSVDATPLATGDKKRPLTQSLAQNAVLSYLYFPPFDWEQLH